MRELNLQIAIEELQSKKVRYVWKLDIEAYRGMCRFKDDRGQYIWTPDLSGSGPGKFLGCDISIVPEESFELVILYPSEATALPIMDKGSI